jgi:hypothetical protein
MADFPELNGSSRTTESSSGQINVTLISLGARVRSAHIELGTIMEQHGEAIVRSWTDCTSPDDRVKLLLGVLPEMPRHHAPDMRAHLARILSDISSATDPAYSGLSDAKLRKRFATADVRVFWRHSAPALDRIKNSTLNSRVTELAKLKVIEPAGITKLLPKTLKYIKQLNLKELHPSIRDQLDPDRPEHAEAIDVERIGLFYWPHIDIEDLTTDGILPLLLRSRAGFDPDVFASPDAAQSELRRSSSPATTHMSTTQKICLRYTNTSYGTPVPQDGDSQGDELWPARYVFPAI